MFQVRGRDGRVYSAGRDLVQLFPRVAQRAAQLLEMGSWHPTIREAAMAAGLTNQHLIAAEVALAKYCGYATTSAAETREAAWVNSGLAALHPFAQLMVFFFLGTVTADTYLQAVRESTPANRSQWGVEKMAELIGRHAHTLRAESPRIARRRAAEAAAAAAKLQSPNMFDS